MLRALLGSPQSLYGSTKMVWTVLKDIVMGYSLINKLGKKHTAIALCLSSDSPIMQIARAVIANLGYERGHLGVREMQRIMAKKGTNGNTQI
jgi:hypothetical protein